MRYCCACRRPSSKGVSCAFKIWKFDAAVAVGNFFFWRAFVTVFEGDFVHWLRGAWIQGDEGWQGIFFAAEGLSPDLSAFGRLPLLQQIRDFAGLELGGGFGDGCCVICCGAADADYGTLVYLIIAVFDCASVIPHNAVDVTTAAADGAGVVAVCNAADVIPHNAADISVAADLAGIVAVFDGAVISPHNTADISVAADAAGTGEDAACDVATVVVADDAADIPVAADAAGDGEVLHGAFVVTAGAEIAKEALIIGIAAGVFYVEAADFEVLAVKGAGVFVAAVADWGPVAC